MVSASSNGNNKQWMVWGAGVILSLALGIMAVQWQSSIDATNVNERDLEQLQQLHRDDIARLDESNRNRRNQIADLEERIARLEERTGG